MVQVNDQTSTTSNKKPLRCKRIAVDAPREFRLIAHRAKMDAKNAARPKRRAGFFPVPNGRINDAIEAQRLLLQMDGRTATEADQEARRAVARNLPARRMDYFTLAGPSKSDDRDYRMGNR